MTGLVCWLWAKFLAMPYLKWIQNEKRPWAINSKIELSPQLQKNKLLDFIKLIFIFIASFLVAIPPFVLIVWIFGKLQFFIS